MAVYTYFAISLVGCQLVQVSKEVSPGVFTSEDPEDLNVGLPLFLIFEFLFYMGWLKVASNLYNPFGDDDEDLALMDLLNGHIKICMKIIDVDKDDIPEVLEDEFWKPPSCLAVTVRFPEIQN